MLPKVFRIFASAFVCVILSCHACWGATPKLEDILTSHDSTIDAIRSLYCKTHFSFVTVGQDGTRSTEVIRSELWLSGSTLRLKLKETDQFSDSVWESGELRSLVTKMEGGQPYISASRTNKIRSHTQRGDPWIRGLLVVNRPGTVQHTRVRDIFKEALKVSKVKEISINGQVYYEVTLRLEYDDSRSDCTITFNPEANYLIHKIQIMFTGSTYRREAEVKEYGWHNGVAFPKRVSGLSEADGKLSTEHESIISEVRINHPIDRDIFKLNFPKGIMVSDSIRGTYYEIDSSGNRLKETPLARYAPPTPAPDAESVQTQTTEEPSNGIHWMFIVGAFIVVIAMLLHIKSRLRNSRAA